MVSLTANENRQHAENQFKQLLNSRNEELQGLFQTDGPESVSAKNLQQDRDQKAAELQRCKNTLGGRALQIFLKSKWVFFVAALLVLVAEALVNKVLFDMVLLSNSLFSILCAFFISAFLIFFSHHSGRMIRQVYSEYHKEFSWYRLILGAVFAFIVLFAVLGIMYTRAFFEALNLAGDASLALFGEAATKIFSEGFSQFWKLAFSTSESTVMGAVNFFALFGAFAIAVFSHDSCYEYDQRYQDFLTADKKLEKKIEKYAKSTKTILNKYAAPIDNAKTVFTDSGGNPDSLPDMKFDLKSGLLAKDASSSNKVLSGRISWLDE